jgi:SAM-dependent methyltransferase
MAGFWFPEFNEAYENYKHQRKLQIKLEQLKPFLRTGAFADIGCGGGDLVSYLKENYGKFSSYTGIDVMDWRSEPVREKIDFRVFNFAHPEGPLADKFDFATCMAVIHHVGRDESSRLHFLRNIRESLQPDGLLLVEEDVILPSAEIAAHSSYQQETGHLRKDQPLYGEYLDLEPQEQEHVLIIIDLLANSLTVGVPDMDFPFGFLSIDAWVRLFRKAGYVPEKIQITGFVRGTFNRSSHVIYLLRRT